MKSKVKTHVLVYLGFCLLAASGFADIPSTMSYQGRLFDNAGDPVADLEYDVTFRIYDGTDTVLWEESHLVATTDGLFTVNLGSNGSPLTADIFNHSECWLGITVGTDPEITPRTELNTVPYAFRTGVVQSSDIINEPGVAAFSGAYYVYLEDQDYTVLCSLTIACPAEGYVMAIAHGRIATLPEHTSGINSYATVGISDVATSLPGNQDLDFHIDSTALSGTYSIPFGMTSMFTVPSAGAYTYYYLAYEYSGSVSVADMQFNLVYFPTAYGPVDPVPPPVKTITADNASWFDGLGRTDNLMEEESERPDLVQLERELNSLKEKITTLQQQIEKLSESSR